MCIYMEKEMEEREKEGKGGGGRVNERWMEG